VLGIACVPLAGLSLAFGNVGGAVLALGMAGGAMGMGRSIGKRIEAVQLTNTAVQHLTRGDLQATEEALAAIPAVATRRGIVARAVGTLRALIALYEGRLEESVSYATSAIEGRLGLFTRTFESGQVAAAHAVRGLAYAALGDTAKAKADADDAESSVDASPEVIARARMVRALLASRAAYHEEAFRMYLAANARLVLEHAWPRERALFRALRRMSRSPQRSVYREPSRMQDDRAPSKVASWIAYVAPDAAAYVEGDRPLAQSVEEIPIASGVPSGVPALLRARAGTSSVRGRGRSGRRLIAIWGSLVIVLLAVWQILTPSSGGHASLPSEVVATTPASWFSSLISSVLPVAAVGVAFVILMSLSRRQHRSLALARRQAALGHRDRARPTLESLTEASDGLVAAAAGLELAKLAATEANFAEAISRCDAAIARVHAQPLRAVASDLLLPALLTESAVATAARGGLEDADAELTVLCRDFPTYPHLASAQLRVRLVRAVRAGDRDAACQLARARTADLPLPYREDVLADLVLASRRDVAEEDLARLDAELREDEGLRRWIDAIAPGLRDDTPLHGRQARIAMQHQTPAHPAPTDDEVLLADDGTRAGARQ
jgi:tetratricopeptide (TPR) repeat protein